MSKYEFKREDAFDFVSAFGYETRQKGNELEFKRCPYCHGGDHKDEWTFSLDLEKGCFKCLRASCDQSGHFVELCRDFDYRLEFDAPKIFKKLPQKKPDSTVKAIEYMKSRGISEAVTRKYRITTRNDNPDILVFPFYDEEDYLHFVKYRNAKFRKGVDKNKEWCESNTMPILFGMNLCVGFDRLIITEGQIDSISVTEAGFDNAVSVPTGATGFTWLTYCADWISRFKEIIVFGDCEKGKITLLDTLRARLPKSIVIRAVRIKDYLGEKDANDILRLYGAKAIRKCIENAEIPKLNNVKQLADVKNVDINKLDKIKTGIFELDRTIRGMAMGQLIILTGKRGEGKSTLMSQIICEALDQNRTVFCYSGELADFHFKRWIDYQLAGSRHVIEQKNEFGEIDYAMDSSTVEKISEWYRDRMYIYENEYLVDESQQFESLPETIVRVINQYNVQLICIDNLMTAMERVEDNDHLYMAQSNFVGKLKAIAQKYSVVIILIAHPKKADKSKSQDDNDLVAGSADITNKADIVIKYQRDESNSDDDTRSLISVSKNRLMGTLRLNQNAIPVVYSEKTKRICGLDQRKEKVYGWESMSIRKTVNPVDLLPF